MAPRPRYTAAPVFRARNVAAIRGVRRYAMIRGVAAYRTVARSRFARRIATATRRDQLIRAAVAPRSAYTTTATGAAGGGGQVGQASYYALASRTANGGHVGGATCAHRSLPFGTRVLVTNLANAHQMVLTVNDRGPFTGGRIIDVSRGAAGFLGMLHSGTAPVRVQVMGNS